MDINFGSDFSGCNVNINPFVDFNGEKYKVDLGRQDIWHKHKHPDKHEGYREGSKTVYGDGFCMYQDFDNNKGYQSHFYKKK